MSTIVCTQCQSELKVLHSGIYVIEYARQEPYKIWMADEHFCPGCLLRIITSFADHPIALHFDNDFETILKDVLKNPEHVRHNREWQDRVKV